MRSLLFALPFIVLAFLCWGIYGPVLHEGQRHLGIPMQPSSLRPFICVGVAYFLIAVVVPIVWLNLRGESGKWTATGAIWSFGAGAAGALGALGIILAFKNRGDPIYVMPLVFGLAPVVNTFVTMAMSKAFKEASPIFFAGVIVVATGAAGVMAFKPAAKNVKVEAAKNDGPITVTVTEIIHETNSSSAAPNSPESTRSKDKESHDSTKTTTWTAANLAELKSKPELATAYKLYLKSRPVTFHQLCMIVASIALTALCWGSYGPVLHKGQMKMAGSRLRPFLCVGWAYFLIAVLAPVPLLSTFIEPGTWNVNGIAWSLAGGAAGAVGALGIILAFNFGGKPIFVMPLVFGGAPVVNTLTTTWHEGTFGSIEVPFYAALMLVVGGAMTVLIFAPKHKGKPPEKSAANKPRPATAAPPPGPSSSTSTANPDADPESGLESQVAEETMRMDEKKEW